MNVQFLKNLSKNNPNAFISVLIIGKFLNETVYLTPLKKLKNILTN